MLTGSMRHKDSRGNEGVIEPGGVQWMTAGSGIIHSEMPEQQQGRLWGFQLWVNLPAQHKMMAPRYQDIRASEIPVLNVGSSQIRIMAGEQNGAVGPIRDIVTKPTLLDLQVESPINLSLPKRALIYVYQGALTIAGQKIEAQHLGLLSEESILALDGRGKALIFAAEPLQEPIARQGPFVMNHRDELIQAFDDYQTGQFG